MESGAVHDDHDHLSDHNDRSADIDVYDEHRTGIVYLDGVEHQYCTTEFVDDGRIVIHHVHYRSGRTVDLIDRPEFDEFVYVDDGRYWNDGPNHEFVRRGESDSGDHA